MQNKKKVKEIMNKIIKPVKLEKVIKQKDNPFVITRKMEDNF